MLNNVKNDSYYSPEELAKKFKLSLSSIYKLVRSGKIPSIRLGKIYRIPESDLNQYLQRQRETRQIRPLPVAASKFLELLRGSPIQGRVRELFLYGSYARQDYDPDSDIDLLLVVDRLDLKTRRLISSLAEQAMAQVDYQDLLSLREEDAEAWNRMKKEHYPLAQNILREGISLWKNQ